MAGFVWLVKAGSSSDNTVYNTGAPPTAVDIFYTNGFTLTVNTALVFAKISNSANAAIPVVAGGQVTLAINAVWNCDIEKIGNVSVVATAGFNFSWTGSLTATGGTASSPIETTGTSGTSVITLNIINCSGASGNNFIRLNSNLTTTININLSTFVLPSTLIGFSAGALTSIYINGVHSQPSFGYCVQAFTAKFYIVGTIIPNAAVLVQGLTAPNFVTIDAIDYSFALTNQTFPVIGAWKFNTSVPNFFKVNFSDGTTKTLSWISGSPPPEKVERGYAYDFNTKFGSAWRVPNASIPLGMNHWDGVGTMNLAPDVTNLTAAIAALNATKGNIDASVGNLDAAIEDAENYLHEAIDESVDLINDRVKAPTVVIQ